MGLVIALIAVGFFLGFLVGARSREIVAKMKKAAKAVLSLGSLFVLKETAVQAGLDGAEAMDDAGEEDEDDGKKAEEAEDFLDNFLDPDDCEGLDDHPELEISPIFMYNIKKSKDEQRVQMRRQTLLAEGLGHEEVEELMNIQGGGATGGYTNPLALLVSMGARVEAVKGKTSDEMRQKIEVKRKQRNVSVYLEKVLETEPGGKSRAEHSKGGVTKTPFDMARETKLKRVGGPAAERKTAAVVRARLARQAFRSHVDQDPDLFDKLKGFARKNEETQEERQKRAPRRLNIAGGIDPNDIATLLKEEGHEDEDIDDGDEDDEDENDDDDDDEEDLLA